MSGETKNQIAVALHYDKTGAPRVVAKGRGSIGARINPEWQILSGHLAFLAVLMVRPRGLFPSRRP